MNNELNIDEALFKEVSLKYLTDELTLNQALDILVGPEVTWSEVLPHLIRVKEDKSNE